MMGREMFLWHPSCQSPAEASVPAEDLGSLENVDTDVDDNFQAWCQY